jgi:6-phosphogluconolactonase
MDDLNGKPSRVKSDAIRIHEDIDAMKETFAEELCNLANDCINEKGSFSLALTGGNTPRPLYHQLGISPWRENVDWNHVKIFFGDERSVVPDHEDSNYGMARDSWLTDSPVPDSSVFRMEGEAEDLDAAASRYGDLVEQHVADRSSNGFPALDLVLLGMGDDGHIASLFPGTRALDEKKRSVVSNQIPQQSTWRITMTYPQLNAAGEIWMLVTGEKKAERISQVLGSAPGRESLPASGVRPLDGKISWWLDRGAAGDELLDYYL